MTVRFLVVLASLAAFAASSEAAETMSEVANDFYAAYVTLHPSDGIPDGAQRTKFEPFLSPALDELLRQGATAQRRFASGNKNAPPLIEGDLFTSMFEGATSYKVGTCSGDAENASCAVALDHDNGKKPPTRWIDTLYLVMTAKGWRVDDIGYGGDWAFSNRGRLTATLREAITDAGG
jgi:hypothetical protein